MLHSPCCDHLRQFLFESWHGSTKSSGNLSGVEGWWLLLLQVVVDDSSLLLLQLFSSLSFLSECDGDDSSGFLDTVEEQLTNDGESSKKPIPARSSSNSWEDDSRRIIMRIMVVGGIRRSRSQKQRRRSVRDERREKRRKWLKQTSYLTGTIVLEVPT